MRSLSAHHLTLKRRGISLVDDLSIRFDKAGSIAVIGPNGAGKSSLLKMLAGLEPPSSGQVLLDSQPLQHVAKLERARTIGYLPQSFAPHWDLTVSELVAIGAARDERLPLDALPRALSSFELVGLERRRWSSLSGGEQARVLLAMVLVADPPLLLADEPAASLDIRHRLDVLHRLAHRGTQRLSLVVVHDLELAFAFFDRILLLDRGSSSRTHRPPG